MAEKNTKVKARKTTTKAKVAKPAKAVKQVKVTKKDNKLNEIAEKKIVQFAVGRRKRAVARVRMYDGDGKIIINGKDINDLNLNQAQISDFYKPLEMVGAKDNHDFTAKVVGGGMNGQIEAVRLGVARCLAKISDDVRMTLSKGKFLKRDPREKERKKIFHVRARKGQQSSKR